MPDDCDICRGSGYVRMPVWPKPSVVAIEKGTGPISMGESSRSYPCPQCANIVSDDHVKVLDHNMLVDTRFMSNANYMPDMRRSAAHAMVDLLVNDGFVKFHLSDDADAFGRQRLRAELGVVSPAHVATLEARIAERQREVAEEVAAEAIRYIDNWGSFYGQEGISKSQASIEINQALKNVVAKRSATYA